MSLLDALLLDPAPFQFWIAKRTDGIKGSGLTPGDPWDGSTQARFDEAMNLFASQSNVTIRLGPGEFQTNGYADGVSGGWQARPGMKIIGSGTDVTKLTLINVAPSTAKHFFAVGHSLSTVVDTFLVSDLTIDCNIAGANSNAACGAVRVMGNHAHIERVKVKNWGAKSASVPCFALSVITAYPDSGPADVVNGGIESCVVVEPYNSNAAPVTALNVGSQNDLSFTKEGHAKSPFIRNCYVDCGVATPSPSGNFRAISAGWCRGGVVEGNQVYNADVAGPYQDLRSVRDLIVRNNVFKNVARAAYLNLGQLGATLLSSNASLSVSNGVATISGGGLNVTSLAAGDRVSIETNSPSTFTGVHTITSVQSSPSAQFTFLTSLTGSATVASVKKVLSVSRAIIEGNVIELAQVSGAIALAVADNNDGGTYQEPPDYAHGDLIIRNNKIRYLDGAAPNDSGAILIELKGAKNVMVQNNVLDTIATTPLVNQRCGSATYFNNKTPSGVLLRGWNSDTSRKYDELETEAEDAFILGMMKRQ
jgi:hypothetical protein